jgi:predicted DNA-binding WGR domain protein
VTALHLVLEARDPARNVWRRYELVVERDLFGVWLVEVTFGRIGSPGRTRVHSYVDEGAARRFALACVHRRQSAPRRIGTPYCLADCADPDGWLDGLPLM